MRQVTDHAFADRRDLHLRELEYDRVGDVPLLDRRLAAIEEPRLAVVVGEALGAELALLAADRLGKAAEPALGIGPWPALGPGVRLVVRPPLRPAHLHVPVLLEVVDRAARRVDRDMGEVGSAEPLQLGVEIGEVPALQQRIVGEVDAGDDVLGAEGDLLGFGEEVVDHAVEHEPADHADRQLLLGDDLGRVEHVEGELVGEGVVEDLQAELPLRKVAGL